MAASSNELNSVSFSDSEEQDEIALLCLLLIRRRRRRLPASCRKTWTKRWIMRREAQGAFNNLIRELNAEDPEKFRQFHRVDRQSFEEILGFVHEAIVKRDTTMRNAITPRERLSVTLRYLATGMCFTS